MYKINMDEKLKVEKLKEVLLHVYKIDIIVNKFHNKVQFMNLNFLMGRAGTWSETKLTEVEKHLSNILSELEKVKAATEALEQPALGLVDSYTLEQAEEIAYLNN